MLEDILTPITIEDLAAKPKQCQPLIGDVTLTVDFRKTDDYVPIVGKSYVFWGTEFTCQSVEKNQINGLDNICAKFREVKVHYASR